MTEGPITTVLIPARNEAADIEACLARVLAQDHPRDLLEVIVVDGDSVDDTATRARSVLAGARLHRSTVVSNPAGTTPSNLNVGLQHATGDVVCRVDARTLIESHYVRTCAEVLRGRPDVIVVGGAQIAIARDESARATGIARALNNRWSMGGSRYRRQTVSGPSDTVYLGAFRRSDLIAVDGWDERLTSNQDFDLNERLGARGVVWFDHRLRSGYVPRASWRSLWQQYRRFGRAKVAYWRITGARPQRRQWLAMLAPPATVVAAVVVARGSGLRAVSVVVGAALVVLAAEVFGSDEPEGAASAHVCGALSMVLVAGGWLAGVAEGVVRRPSAGAPSERATT